MGKKKFLATIGVLYSLLLALPVTSFAGYGDWRVYAAYHKATDVALFNHIVYVVSNDGLYSYDPEYANVETYDKSTILSDEGIIDIIVCEATNQLVIVYANGNVDLLDANGNIYNMPELKEKSLSDKSINDTYVDADNIYISTGSGIVILDTRRKVFAGYYNFGHSVNSLAIDDGYIVALTSDGVYKGALTDNLLDANSWSQVSTRVLNKLISFGGRYYALSPSNRVVQVTNNETFAITTFDNVTIDGYSVCDDNLFFFSSSVIHKFEQSGNHSTLNNDLGIFAAINSGNDYWLACGANGLIGARFTDNTFSTVVSSIIPTSPIRNYFYRMRHYGSRLLSVGGALETSSIRREFTAQMYENGMWSYFNEDSLRDYIGSNNFYNALDIIQDPNDPDHQFVSAVTGLYEFRHQHMVKHYTYNNSVLTSILPNDTRPGYFVRVAGLAFDDQSNLWMLNSGCDSIIKILRTDGTWLSYYCPEIANNPICDQIMFDERGWAWIVSRASGSNNAAGLFILDTNGTLNQRSDDTQKVYHSMVNQDGTSYLFDRVNCVVTDLDGSVWIGTNVGPFMTYNPSAIFGNDFTITQCKVPRNDGTGYADYLLGEVEVRCIAVDGGNRKWMGTQGSGVYLVNSDGSEILEHFTSNNSPLLSDYIYSISIDGNTGEVFFGTSAGLVSYMGNATDPEESFNKDLVKVYPNPVRPNYMGKIIIRGLMSNSVVKIVNAAGRLVNEGVSVGGEYTWDGRTNNGSRVASGVYYILATDEEGDKGVASKFLVVKE